MLLGRVKMAIGELGISFTLKTSGGASDANIFNEYGIEALNLGVGTENVHSENERIKVREFF